MTERREWLCTVCKGPLIHEPSIGYGDIYFCSFCNEYYRKYRNDDWWTKTRTWRLAKVPKKTVDRYNFEFQKEFHEIKVKAPHCLVRWYPVESKIVPDANFLEWFRGRNRNVGGSIRHD